MEGAEYYLFMDAHLLFFKKDPELEKFFKVFLQNNVSVVSAAITGVPIINFDLIDHTLHLKRVPATVSHELRPDSGQAECYKTDGIFTDLFVVQKDAIRNSDLNPYDPYDFPLYLKKRNLTSVICVGAGIYLFVVILY